MKKTIITLLIIQFGLSVSCQSKNLHQSEIVIPIDMSSHRPIMDVMINGQGPYKFIFDTGSSTNVLDENLQKRFNFEVVGEDPLHTPGSENKLYSKRVSVTDLAFRGTSLSKPAEMNVISLRSLLPVDGIIGGFFFEEYLTTIDYPVGTITLTKGSLDASNNDVISYIQDARTLNFMIDLDGNEIEAHLDSGNPLTMTIPYSLRPQLNFIEGPIKGVPMRTPVASFDTWEAQLDGEVLIGNAVIKNPRVRLAEGYEYVNIGYAVINTLKTTIDRKNSLIKFEKNDRSGNSLPVKKVTTSAQGNEFSGLYEGDRKIWIDENGKLVYQRTPAPIPLEMVKVGDDLYEMKIPEGVRAPMEIPRLKFNRNANREVVSITLIYKDGREDGPYSRVSN